MFAIENPLQADRLKNQTDTLCARTVDELASLLARPEPLKKVFASSETVDAPPKANRPVHKTVFAD
jgi:hypothetical protein